MARRTKKQIETDKAVDAAVQTHIQGRQFSVFDLGKISDAGHNAANNGEDIDAAVKAAAEQYAIKH